MVRLGRKAGTEDGVNRPLVIGTVGGVIVATAIALTFFVDYGSRHGTERTAAAPQAVPAAPEPAAGKLSAPASVEHPVLPSFDVVRVNPQGDTVIAGRAQPDSEVTVREGDREIGRATADARGEWVLVPKQPLAPGSRELSLTARGPDGSTASASDKVVVLVPERGKDVAGRTAAAEKAGALALRVPSGGGMGTTVLQKPGGGAEPAAARHGGSALGLDAVDYDDAGRLALSGHAPVGAHVNVYLDNRLLGTGIAGPDRVWRIAPDKTVPPGLYTLRVDQLGTGGKVVARVETRFVRSEPLGNLPRDSVVLVQPGNSLWRLARQAYGHGTQYTVIFEANRKQIRDPDLIYPGQVFMVPKPR
jgi:nucleoid-associated protein YgaU